jgi:hypothetical protein
MAQCKWCGSRDISPKKTPLILIPENREHREQRVEVRAGEESPIVGRIIWSWRAWA